MSIGIQEEQIKQLGIALSDLREFVPCSKTALQRWYDEAQLIIDDRIKGRIDVPHFLWHYLSDADIRMESAEYAEMQNARMDLLLLHLKRGSIPSDDEI